MLLKRLGLPNGHQITAEIVCAPEDMRRGLAGRASLASHRGMLFVFRKTGQHPMWMHGTRMPLDIIWLDQTGRIVELATGQPFSTARLGGNAVSAYVLELPRGQGLQVGQAVSF